MIGDVLLECELEPGEPRTLAGFENHAGRTILDAGAEPLGRVVAGFGNDGESGFEGCRLGRALGTYLHGPLLPRNPWLADWLLGAGARARAAASRRARAASRRARAQRARGRRRAGARPRRALLVASDTALVAADTRAPPPSARGLGHPPPAFDGTGELRTCLCRTVPDVRSSSSPASAPRARRGTPPGRPGCQRMRKRWIGGWSGEPEQLVELEQAMAAHGGVLRGDRLERAVAEMAGEDDVDDVLRPARPAGAIDSTTPTGPSSGSSSRDPALLARAPAAARRRASRRSSTPPPGSSQYSLPAFSWRHRSTRPSRRRIAETRMRGSITPTDCEEPKPRSPRSLGGSSSTSTTSTAGTRSTTSCAIRSPGSATKVSRPVGVQEHDAHLAAVAGVDEARRVHDRDSVLVAASPERGCTKPA